MERRERTGHRASGRADANWELIQLSNGAQLVLAPMPDRQSVAASVLLRVGSRWESRRLAGVSHFLEHIVFKGTRRFPTSRSVSESIEGIGGILNASTDKELTNFWVKVPGGHLEEALRLLFDLAFAPTIDEVEVERERKVVLEELHMYLDQPGELVQMIFDLLHPGPGGGGGRWRVRSGRGPGAGGALLRRAGPGRGGTVWASH
jgi:predicted Zn-dependent peptidase